MNKKEDGVTMKSMTAFARIDGKATGYSLELKCVNHRFLDIHVHVPPWLGAAEFKIHALIREQIKRGKVDLRIQSEDAALSQEDPVIFQNAKVLADWLQALQKASGLSGELTIEHLLLFKDQLGNFSQKLTLSEALWQDLEPLLRKLVREADEFRKREGDFLGRSLSEMRALLEDLVKAIAQRAPKILEDYRGRLQARIAELVLDPSDSRSIETEIVLFADRSDTSEEITRLASHLREWQKFEQADGPIGRKFDFLLQEMNREVNTIGAKGNDSQISRYIVELKTVLEQMREQVQNIE